MANAMLRAREASLTLALSEMEAALVLGILGRTNVKNTSCCSHAAIALNRIVAAIVDSGLKPRMTDYGVHVGAEATVVST